MSFAALTDDMDIQIMSSLNDGRGDYLDASGRCNAKGIQLIVDHNLQQIGPDGSVLQTNAVGITFLLTELRQVERGGIFRHDGQRYVVETEISNDGQWVTTACMVLK